MKPYMETKYINAAVVKGKDGKIQFVATDETMDRQGESIAIDSWDLSEFQKSPRLLVNHDYKVQSIVGIATNIARKGKQLLFDPVFHDITELARDVKAMIDGGFLDTVSVGFQPTQIGEKVVNKLLEISFVAVPANPNARRLAYKAVSADEDTAIAAFVKAVEVTDEKGAVADVIDERDAFEKKWENMKRVAEIVDAFWSAYYSTDTPVDAFAKMLNETIALLQKVAPDEKELTADTVAKLIGNADNSMFGIKAGRVLSEKNRTLITETKTKLDEATAALGTLLDATASPEGDGKGGQPATDKPVEKVEKQDGETAVEIDADTLALFRAASRGMAQHAELQNSIINRLFKKI